MSSEIAAYVGAAYPMLRTNTLLSALHPVMQSTPLLMFYPGRYDGFSLSLFNKLKAKLVAIVQGGQRVRIQ